MSKEKESEINIIVDSVGRTIVGRVRKTKTMVEVDNPAIVNIEVRQDTGQIAVQLLPYVFKEFISPEQRTGVITWTFPKNLVVVSDNIQIDDALKVQYANVHERPVGSLSPEQQSPPSAPSAPPVEQPSAPPEVIKLFDDE